MKKSFIYKKSLLILSVLVCFMLTGCDKNSALTKEQNDLLAEYTAGVLIKYSYENQWKYYKLGANITNFKRPDAALINANAANNPTPTDKKENQTSKADTSSDSKTNSTATGDLTDLANAFRMNGVSISYANSILTKSYPEGADILQVRATSKKEIIAVEFNLTNNTSNTVSIDTASLSTVLKLNVNNLGNVTEYATLLNNDINSLKDFKIEPSTTKKAVALFMIPEGKVTSVDSLVLTVGGQDVSSAKITLK